MGRTSCSRMAEAGFDPLRHGRELLHEGGRFLQQGLLVMADRSRAQGRLEVTIQVFVRVGLRGIGWQEHQLDLVRFVCQPSLDQGRVMHAQVVD